MDDSLFGNVVIDANTFFLPSGLAAAIEALPTLETISISDRSMGIGDVRSVRPELLNFGRVKIEGAEWDSFVRDRGIRVGDVLLLKLVYRIPNIINITVIRLDGAGENIRTVIPPMPPPQQPQEQDHHRSDQQQQQQQQPFLRVKKLTEADMSSRLRHQIQLPREVAEAIIAEPGDWNGDNFVVRVRDQTYRHIEMETKLKLRADGEVLFGDNWAKLVEDRGLKAEDVVVFCVDLARRIITTTVYRADQERDFFIPSPPYHA